MKAVHASLAAVAALGIAALALAQANGLTQNVRRAEPYAQVPPPMVRDAHRVQDNERPAMTEQDGPCLSADLVRGARVVVLGAYEGRRKTALNVGGPDHDTGIIGVGANAAGPPVVLVLAAYDPVIWDLRDVPGRRLRAVIAYGYYDPGVVGVPRATPVRFVNREDEAGPCGQAAYAYEGGRDLEELAVSVEQATGGRRIDSFQGGYAPEGFHLDGGAAPVSGSPFTISEIRGARAAGRDGVAPREEGLRQLLGEGAIRLATPADIARLDAALTRASPTGYLAPVHAGGLRADATYVILRAITVPRGMYGAHSASFLIPQGVPAPVDPGSHNTYYSLSSGRCQGAICEH